MVRTVEITPAAIAELAQALPSGQPVTMLNLLRFRDAAQYNGEDLPPCSGRDAYYKRYAPVATGLVVALGGKVIWAGQAAGHTVCPPDERWDDILIVEYPDVAAIAGLFRDPAYQAVVKHRTAALVDSRLIPMRAGGMEL
ncbi:MAG: DUF1330 domain-containing protein [Pseudomonadota bacterium]